MTPARLEEVRVHVEHQRRYYSVRGQAPRPVSVAVELLDEVDRLRRVLLEIYEATDGTMRADVADIAGQALAGEEPTP